MTKALQTGPARRTITEKLVALSGLPYWIGCVLIVSVIGPPGFFVASYLETGNPSNAFYLTTSRSAFTLTQVGEQLPAVQGLLLIIFFTLLLFIGLYETRYLRVKVHKAADTLSSLSPRGLAAYRDAFGHISSLPGPLSITLVLSLLYVPPRIFLPVTPIVVYSSAAAFFDVLVFGTAFWVYLSNLRGIYKFGQGELDLVEYYEDRMLGLRPLGSIAISSGLVFLFFVIVALPGAFLATDPTNLAVVFAIFSLGTVVFFLSLHGIHGRMLTQKIREEASIQSRFNKVVRESNDDHSDIDKSVSEIRELMKTRMIKEEISKIPTWPFETRIIERFIAIVIAIISVILARLFQLALHL